jgi:hypothetical protein
MSSVPETPPAPGTAISFLLTHSDEAVLEGHDMRPECWKLLLISGFLLLLPSSALTQSD